MTAIRIIDRYEDLADVPSGSYSPTQINQTLDFLLSGSTSGSGDPYASYVVVNPTSSLPNARRVVTGSGIIITDNPGSGTLTFSVDPSYVRSLIQWNETPDGAIDGSNTTFTLAHVPIPSGALSLYYNGQLRPRSDRGLHAVRIDNHHIFHASSLGQVESYVSQVIR